MKSVLGVRLVDRTLPSCKNAVHVRTVVRRFAVCVQSELGIADIIIPLVLQAIRTLKTTGDPHLPPAIFFSSADASPDWVAM